MLICARCAANPLAGSPLRASNSAFNYSQPEARHRNPSAFIRTGSCAPNSVCLQSSCNPTLQLAAARHLCLVLFSSPLLHTVFVSPHLCMAASSETPLAFFLSFIFTRSSLPLPHRHLLPRPRDSCSCGIAATWFLMNFAPRQEFSFCF